MRLSQGWPWVLLAATVHLLLAWLVLSHPDLNHVVVPVWPTTGLSMALVALGGPRYALASMLGVATAVIVVGGTWQFALWPAVSNLIEALIAGTILGRHLDRTQPFATLAEVLWLPIAALCGAGVSAALGALGFSLAQGTSGPEALRTFVTWWLGNAMGGLVVTPAVVGGLLALMRKPPERLQQLAGSGETACVLALAAVLTSAVFGDWADELVGTQPFPFLLFPVMTWLALRGAPASVAAMNVVVSAVSILGTARGHGPFASERLLVDLAQLQAFLFTLCGMGLILAAVNAQRRAAQQLALDRQRTQNTILNHVPSVAWSSDEQGNTRFVSPNVKRVIGFSADEIIASGPRLWFDRIHPDDLPTVLQRYQRLFSEGQFDLEYRYQAHDGRWLWLRDQGTPTDETIDGRRLAVGVFTDVTLRKQAELDLLEERAVLKCQSELSKDGILVVSTDRQRLAFNARLGEIFRMPAELLDNWTSERALAHAAQQVVDPEAYLEAIQRLYPDPSGKCDDVVQFKDGRTVARYSAPVRDEHGRYIARVWYYRDVTGEKRAEETLRDANQELERRVAQRTADLAASQQLFESLAAVSPVGIFKTDADGACQYVNRRWQEITGLSADEALGDGWSRALHPDDRARVIERWQAGAMSGDRFQEEYRFLAPQGRVTWVLGQAQPLADAVGRTVGHVGTITDITAQKDLNARLHRQQSDLAHFGRLNSVGEMSAALVHELGQPLTAISNFAAGCLLRLDNGNFSPEHLRDVVRSIEHESNRAASIIRLVRNFIRKRPLARGATDVNAAIRDTLGILAYEARRRGIQLQTQLSEDLPPSRAEAVELQQVVLNLVRNAKEAAGGAATTPQVTIVTGRDAQGRIEVIVRDNGPGLSPADAQRAFEPFHTTKPDGLGLGLAISRSIVESLGGRLWLADNSPKGAEFRFTLPAADDPHVLPHR